MSQIQHIEGGGWQRHKYLIIYTPVKTKLLVIEVYATLK